MLKTKLFMSMSAFVLFIAGVFAGKTSKRFVGVTTIYYKNGTVCVNSGVKLATPGFFVTSSTAGVTCVTKVLTSSCLSQFQLYYTHTCSAAGALYVKP